MRLTAGLLLVVFGLPAAVLGALRLGWRRHGTSSFDLGFLHLDWALHPSLPHWRAHVENLATLAVGWAMIAVALVLLTRSLRRLSRTAG